MDINPYLESFDFLANNKTLKDSYSLLSKEVLDDEKTFSGFIEKIKEFIKEDDNLKSSPQKAFKCFLNVLHSKFQKNAGDDTKIKSADMNRDNAFKSFKQFMKKDRTIISEKFFGIKLIEKKCKNCNLTKFLFKYLKTITIGVSDINENCKLNIEKCLKKMTKTKFDKNISCSMCSSTQEHEINIEIVEFPYIMILLFPQEEKANFEISPKLINQKYKLIYSKTKTSFLPDFLNCCFNKDIPLVLFYEKINKDEGYEKIVEVINNNQNSFFNDIIDEKSNGKNNDLILISDANEKSSEEKIFPKKTKHDENNKNKITLYFTINEDKEMYIDTNNCITFNEIVKNLKSKYDEINFDENKMFFKGQHIDLEKTPKECNIPSGSYIKIKN